MDDSAKSFFWAIWGHWLPFMTGVFSLFAWVWSLVTKKNLSGKVFLVGAIFLMSYSGYLAWVDERHRVGDQRKHIDELTQRNLEGEVKHFFVGVSGPSRDTAVFYYVVEVRNMGLSPSIADTWRLELSYPGETNRHKVPPVFFRPNEKITGDGPRGRIEFSGEDNLETKAAAGPIPAGGKVTGLASFALPGVARAGGPPVPFGTRSFLSFLDVRKTNHLCTGYTVFRQEDMALGDSNTLQGIFPGQAK
jgi:hypothetical protein